MTDMAGYFPSASVLVPGKIHVRQIAAIDFGTSGGAQKKGRHPGGLQILFTVSLITHRDILSPRALVRRNYLVNDLLALFQSTKTVHVDRGMVNIDVLIGLDRTDNTPSAIFVEILDCAFAHRKDLPQISGVMVGARYNIQIHYLFIQG
jgi:hypothetical protein